MPKIEKLISKYNFYPENLHHTLSAAGLADKGIFGYAGDDPGYPSGKPIYYGAQNNAHLNSLEHSRAQAALKERVKKMDDMLGAGAIAPQDLEAVKRERAAAFDQMEHHRSEHVRLQQASAPTGRLRNLRKTMRGK